MIFIQQWTRNCWLQTCGKFGSTSICEPTVLRPISSISWLLITWRPNRPRHQQPWYWLSCPEYSGLCPVSSSLITNLQFSPSLFQLNIGTKCTDAWFAPHIQLNENLEKKLTLILSIDGLSVSCEMVHRWLWQDFTDDKSTCVQVITLCHQATSHYLNQCGLRSMTS